MLFFLSIIQLPGRWNGRVLPQSPGSRQRFWVLDLVGAFPPCVCVLIRGLWVKIYTHFFFWDGVWWIFPTAGGNQWHHGQSRFHVCSNKLQQCLRKNPIHEDVSWPHWNWDGVFQRTYQLQHLQLFCSLPCWRLISNMPFGNRMGILAWIYWRPEPWVFFSLKPINHPRASGGKQQLAISLPEDAASWLLILFVSPPKKINLFQWFYSFVFSNLWGVYL